ncbi:MAG: tail fiber domain-containing protein, partial [Bacteriovorax sp.]
GLSATGITKATSTIAATDSISASFNKLLFTQGDYVSKTADQTIFGSLAINSTTGFITVPTPINPNDAANKSYVDGFGQWTKGASGSINYTAGNVGIGTTSPTAGLHISRASNLNSDSAVTHLKLSAPSDTRELAAGYDTTNDNAYIQAMQEGNGYKYLALNPRGGDVGIGTTSPGAVLEVDGAVPQFYVGQTGKTRATLFNFSGSYGSVFGTVTDPIVIGTNDTTARPILINYLQNTPGIAIQTSGNVGVGSTSPNKKLKILTSTTNDGMSVGDSANSFSIGLFSNANGPFINFDNSSSTDSAIVTWIQKRPSTDPNPNHLMISNSNGDIILSPNSKVGIGTAAPGFTLDVNGSIASVGALQAHSDKRLKKNIVRVDNALDKLLALNGVYFDWRKDEFPKMHFEGGRQLGVIAQDVEKVFPEAVAKNKEGIRSVAYTMLIAPMIEAFKELNKRVTELFKVSEGHSRDIASVKAENDQIKAENAIKDKKINQLEKENAAKAKELEAVKARLDKIEKKLNSIN